MMSNKLDNLETVWEGWLTKSPPTTRIWRARWRRRWFILRNSGELPGQYFLCYYTDRNCRKLKGQIDLDQCEQVDAGLRFESNKQKYQHLFTIRTPKRIYYLAAESEEDMNKWVDCVCHVCGLKPVISEDTVAEYEGDDISQTATGITDISPPVTPSTIITGPYIPISECISGKPINSSEDLEQFLSQHGHNRTNNITVSDHRADSYDLPRNLRPPQITVEIGTTPPPSPGSESVFTDDETVQKPTIAKKPVVNWETFPRPSDSSVDGEESPGANTATLKADRKFTKVAASPSAPPRPPKPSHLVAGETQSDVKVEELTVDELYDMPRSHQIVSENDTLKRSLVGRHCYSNAAPGHVSENNIFRYDFNLPVMNSDDLPESPRSETGFVLTYSNLPSPSYSTGTQMACTPPVVNRDLKPGRKYSDSTGGSNEPSPILTPFPGPIIDRNKKPVKPVQLKIQNTRNPSSYDNSIVLSSPPVGSLGRCKQRAGPSQNPPNNINAKIQNTGFATTGRMHRRHSSSDDRLAPGKEEVQVYHLNNLANNPRNRTKDISKKFSEVQYLDLDLNSTDNAASGHGLVKKSSENVHTPATAVVYNTVDFVKTIALNRTRTEIEEERRLAAESAL